MIRCDEVIEGVIGKIRLKDEIKSYYRYTRVVHHISCTVDQRPVRFSLQAATLFYLESGDRVQVAGRVVDGVLVAYALRNLTDKSLYCWKTSGGHYQRTVKKEIRIVDRMIMCFAAVAMAGAFADLMTSERSSLSIMGYVAGIVVVTGVIIWICRVAGGPDCSSDHHPGDEATEFSALELLDASTDESSQVIWV